MDKNKSRSNLLAAGRKKLQEFRQQKDGKGSKSSGKATKPDHEVAADFVAQQPVPNDKGPVQESEVADSSVQRDNPGLTVAAVGTLDLSSNSSCLPDKEIIELPSGTPPFRAEDSGDVLAGLTGSNECELSDHFPDKHESTSLLDDGMTTVSSSATIVSEREPSTASKLIAPNDYVELNVAGESRSAPEEHQVSDVGAIHEAYSSGLEQGNRNILMALQGGSDLSLPMLNERAEANSGTVGENNKMEHTTCQAKQTCSSDSLSAIPGASSDLQVLETDVGSVLLQSAVVSKESSLLTLMDSIHPIENLMADPCGTGNYEDNCGKELEVENEDPSLSSFVQSSKSQISSGGPDSLNSLSQLTNMPQVSGEDEFRFLVIERESTTSLHMNSIGMHSLPKYVSSDVMERLEEKLYLTHVEKEMFHLQLNKQWELQMLDCDRRQSDEEKSMIKVSLNEAQRNKGCLDELVALRSGPDVTQGMEDLQVQSDSKMFKLTDNSAQIDELRLELDRLQHKLSNVSRELVDSKGVVATLQLENEDLHGCIASVIKEKMDLEKQKGDIALENEKLMMELMGCKTLLESTKAENFNISGSLALATEGMTKIEEEKKSYLLENEKLVAELANCKGVVDSLQVENVSVNLILGSIRDDRNKLEESKDYLFHENERLSAELMGYKALEETLRMEISVLNANLAHSVQEKEILVDVMENLRMEKEEKAKELMDCRSSITNLQEEYRKAVYEEEKIALHVLHLTEEKANLTSCLDIYKAKITELDNWETRLTHQSEKASNRSDCFNMPSTDKESIIEKYSSQQVPEEERASVFPVPEQNISYNIPKVSSEKLKYDVNHTPLGFKALKMHLEEVEKVMQKLEKAVEGMYIHSAVRSKSVGKQVLEPGISKLIQAFESKVQIVDSELEDVPLRENHNLYMSTKEQIHNLRELFSSLVLDTENANQLFDGLRNDKVLSETKLSELADHLEVLKEQSGSLEANIEVLIFYEVVKHYVRRLEANEENLFVKVEESEIRRKLSDSESRINVLQLQLNEFYQQSKSMASSVNHQLDILLKEVSDRVLLLEERLDSTISCVVKEVEKLDASFGTTCCILSSDASDNQDVGTRVATSVEAAVSVFKGLQVQLESHHRDHDSLHNSYNYMTEKVKDLEEKNGLAAEVLNKIYGDLDKLINDFGGCTEEAQIDVRNKELLDPENINNYDILIEHLKELLSERLQLKSMNRKKFPQLSDSTNDIEELNRLLGSDLFLQLLGDIESVGKVGGIENHPAEPALSLESIIQFLLKKYRYADGQLSLSRETVGIKEARLTELESEIDHLSFLAILYENESLIFKETLWGAVEYLVSFQSEIKLKVTELEQSELRVSSLREKLHIAVTKGKGLVLQRDNLKHSLTMTSSELEKCLHELKLKDDQIYEIETKAKTYSEAGERVEALESELSYIRNSATALRESFLLKDSVLQRIEEILEDLELPEYFHARDVIEKVDWLARLVSGKSLPVMDWDQNSSMGGRSHHDSGQGIMDAWKEDLHQAAVPVDELRRKCEELESKFYGLAEQNEVLQQSLVERNNLFQRWEDILDRINVPAHLRSMKEERVERLGGALSEDDNQCDSLQKKIDNFELVFGSLTANLEDAQSRIAYLEAALQSSTSERYHLSTTSEQVGDNYDRVSGKATSSDVENDNLQPKLDGLQLESYKMHWIEEHMYHVDTELRRLLDLVRKVLQDPNSKDMDLCASSIECLEGLLGKLVDKYTTPSSRQLIPGALVHENISEETNRTHDVKKLMQMDEHEELHVGVLKKEQEESLTDFMRMKEERDIVVDKNLSLVLEVEALQIKRQELQELLIQEEQKSVILKEKLNVAVRKGKSLVQQRDSMRQQINDMTTEMQRLNSEIHIQENTLSEYKQKIEDLLKFRGRVEDMESEILFFRNRLAEKESELEDKSNMLSMVASVLNKIEIGDRTSINDPFKKLEEIEKRWCDLQAAVASSEQNSLKSKRSAELLLAELNEVQERNDDLQDELSKAAKELSQISRERDSVEADKQETLSRLEQLQALHSEERSHQFSELTGLKSVVDQLMASFLEVNDLLGDALPKDLDSLYKLDANMRSLLESDDTLSVLGQAHNGASSGSLSTLQDSKVNSLRSDLLLHGIMEEQFTDNTVFEIRRFVERRLQNLTALISLFKEQLQSHSKSLNEETNHLSEIMRALHSEITSRNQSFAFVKEHIARLESTEKQKDTENLMLRKYISMLFEACRTSVMEIGKCKSQLVGNDLLVVGDLIYKSESSAFVDGDICSGQTLLTIEECVVTMVNQLLLVIKDFHKIHTESVDACENDMKATISELQNQLREKDFQKDKTRIELVSQIKEAEATANSYLQELQPLKDRIHDLLRQLDAANEKQSVLEHTVNELREQEVSSVDVHERVRFLTDALTAKEQETEALMHALDEEESQMESLTNKIDELERIMLQKDIDLENAEASRGKAMKKLSITVNKFDELHHLSAVLLSEVEKLQAQIKERDEEISLLRHEITSRTNDALLASKLSSERSLIGFKDILLWLDSMISGVGTDIMHLSEDKGSQIHGYKEILQKQILAIISEMEDLREVARSKDNLLHAERRKVEELIKTREFLENSLREKESQLMTQQGVGDSEEVLSKTSEIIEAEPMVTQRSVQGTSIAPQVRALRKLNNDHVAVAIDMEPDNTDNLHDEDDDKAHGFKSLTTSKIVPRFTRPVTDLIDGLWVSCDRALMRQPALRLTVIIYWVVLHALLSSFVV